MAKKKNTHENEKDSTLLETKKWKFKSEEAIVTYLINRFQKLLSLSERVSALRWGLSNVADKCANYLQNL